RRADVVLDDAERRAATRQVGAAEIRPTDAQLLYHPYVRTGHRARTANLRIGRGFDAEVTDFSTKPWDECKREVVHGEDYLEPAVGTGMRAGARRLVLVEERPRQLGDGRRERLA